MNIKSASTKLRITLTAIVLLIGAFLLSAPGRARQTQETPAVSLSVLVLDGSKKAAMDVGQTEFRVFEDEVEQKITHFNKDERPLSYGLLIDNSGSLRSQFEDVIEAAETIINANQTEDEAFLMRFVSTEQIQVLQDFTLSKAALQRALNNLVIEGGQTALTDAVYIAAQKLAERQKESGGPARRRALIIVTDGEDRKNRYKPEMLFDFLRATDVQIFIIGLVNQLGDEDRFVQKSSREKSKEYIERLAKETGGRVFYPRTGDELTEASAEIMRDLRQQYLIGYTPTLNPKSKPYRKIKVVIERAKGSEKRTAITRAGYIAPVRVTPKS